MGVLPAPRLKAPAPQFPHLAGRGLSLSPTGVIMGPSWGPFSLLPSPCTGSCSWGHTPPPATQPLTPAGRPHPRPPDGGPATLPPKSACSAFPGAVEGRPGGGQRASVCSPNA